MLLQLKRSSKYCPHHLSGSRRMQEYRHVLPGFANCRKTEDGEIYRRRELAGQIAAKVLLNHETEDTTRGMPFKEEGEMERSCTYWGSIEVLCCYQSQVHRLFSFLWIGICDSSTRSSTTTYLPTMHTPPQRSDRYNVIRPKGKRDAKNYQDSRFDIPQKE